MDQAKKDLSEPLVTLRNFNQSLYTGSSACKGRALLLILCCSPGVKEAWGQNQRDFIFEKQRSSSMQLLWSSGKGRVTGKTTRLTFFFHAFPPFRRSLERSNKLCIGGGEKISSWTRLPLLMKLIEVSQGPFKLWKCRGKKGLKALCIHSSFPDLSNSFLGLLISFLKITYHNHLLHLLQFGLKIDHVKNLAIPPPNNTSSFPSGSLNQEREGNELIQN